MPLDLRAVTIDRLASHVVGQLTMLYPLSDAKSDNEIIMSHIPQALCRMGEIVESVNIFREEYFDHLNSLQYASFLYLLGNCVYRSIPESDMVDRLFGLNKMVSGIELFPAVNLPEPFFLSHALGTVLGNASYGRRLVIFQQVTVGRVGDRRPILGDRVILFVGASVTGSSVIGAGSVVGAGARVHNLHVPEKSLVTPGQDGVVITPLTRDYHSLYFRS